MPVPARRRRDRSSIGPFTAAAWEAVVAPSPFQYAMVRVVPDVERGECLNAGVIVFCRPRRFLAAGVALDERRLQALAPDVDVAAVRAHLGAVERIAAGDPADRKST